MLNSVDNIIDIQAILYRKKLYKLKISNLGHFSNVIFGKSMYRVSFSYGSFYVYIYVFDINPLQKIIMPALTHTLVSFLTYIIFCSFLYFPSDFGSTDARWHDFAAQTRQLLKFIFSRKTSQTAKINISR